jgi:uncharacterized protein
VTGVPGGAGFTLRRARPVDRDRILAINAQGAPGVSVLNPGEIERLFRLSIWFRVAERSSALAAYLIALRSGSDYDGEEYLWFMKRLPEFLYVDQVAVATDARGGGVGSALYDDLESFAAGQGIHHLTLEVNLRPENLPSLSFHDRRGFREIDRLETIDGRLVSLRMKEIP